MRLFPCVLSLVTDKSLTPCCILLSGSRREQRGLPSASSKLNNRSFLSCSSEVLFSKREKVYADMHECVHMYVAVCAWKPLAASFRCHTYHQFPIHFTKTREQREERDAINSQTMGKVATGTCNLSPTRGAYVGQWFSNALATEKSLQLARIYSWKPIQPSTTQTPQEIRFSVRLGLLLGL